MVLLVIWAAMQRQVPLFKAAALAAAVARQQELEEATAGRLHLALAAALEEEIKRVRLLISVAVPAAHPVTLQAAQQAPLAAH
jgi:hypothetical protein